MKRVRFARRRFGRYEVIDFLAVLFGYAIKALGSAPWKHSTRDFSLSQFLSWRCLSVTNFPPALGALALSGELDLGSDRSSAYALFSLICSRAPDKERHTGQLVDRAGIARVVFDIDGTRQVARQRALPQAKELPSPQRRLAQVCAPGYTGRKRGEIVRTRTVVSQAHSYHWCRQFRQQCLWALPEELRWALSAIRDDLQAHELSPVCALLRLDGQYGTGLSSPIWQTSRL